MICPTCGVDVAPFSDFTDQGIQERCPRAECGAIIVTRPTVNVATTSPAVAPAKRTRGAPSTAQPESFDVIKAARARLREVERQIKQLRKLEKERDQLSRLLKAADRPLATVKPIRGSAAT